jgi:hypothetical protein
MTYYHAVFQGEDGMEFGAGTEASSKEEARSILRENYPESRIVQLESPEDTREREARIYAHALAGGDYDDEGRPFFPHGGPEDDWYDDEEDDEDEEEDDYDDEMDDPPRSEWL